MSRVQLCDVVCPETPEPEYQMQLQVAPTQEEVWPFLNPKPETLKP